jgi:hypothetical protein
LALPNSADLTACKSQISQTKFSPVSCPDAACEGNADGWGERAGAAALTVGLIFCRLFHQGKSRKKTLRARAMPTVGGMEAGKSHRMKIAKIVCRVQTIFLYFWSSNFFIKY